MSIPRRDVFSFLPVAMAAVLTLPDLLRGNVAVAQSNVLPSGISHSIFSEFMIQALRRYAPY